MNCNVLIVIIVMFAYKVMLAMLTVSSNCIFLTFQMENNDEEQDFLDNAEENANFYKYVC